jgi:purine-nucleoside phosphorylase
MLRPRSSGDQVVQASWQLDPEWEARIDRTVEHLRQLGFPSGGALGLVLGSGLGGFVEGLEVTAAAEFSEVPGFAGARVEAHAGRILAARAGAIPLWVLQGRPHAYEGLSLAEVVFPCAVLARAGCELVVLTNAAGGLRPGMVPGELAVLQDLVDLHLMDVGRGILRPDPAIESGLFGRALRAGALFDPALSRCLIRTAREEGIGLRRAVYASVWGPNYEEAATVGALRRVGADVVGMSTGPEAAYLHAVGVRVLGLSCITNVAVEHGAVAVSHDEVVEVSGRSGGDFARLLEAAIPALNAVQSESGR